MDQPGDMQASAERRWLADWIAGPRRTRWESLPLQPGDAAPDFRLADSGGTPRLLSSFWREKPLLLVFLRHFGCSCTQARIERLKQERPEIEAAGAAFVLVGQGEPARARAFADRMELNVPVLCDPDRRAYQAYGLLEARPSQIVFGLPDAFLERDPETGAKLQESRRGTPRVPVDSPWQLPGDAVIDSTGTLRLIHRAQFCDDLLESKVFTATLREVQLGLA